MLDVRIARARWQPPSQYGRLLAVVLLATAVEAQHIRPGLVTDAHMDIHTYDSIFQSVGIRIWLRFFCSHSVQHAVTVQGFVFSQLLSNESLPWAPEHQHYTPFNVHKHLNFSIIDRLVSLSVAGCKPCLQ